MLSRDIINEQLNIKESYELPGRLIEIVLDTAWREALFDAFLAKYQTGINVQEGTLKYLKLEIHTSRDTQEWFSDRLDALSEAEDKIQREINSLNELKTFFLEKLFIN